MAGGSWLKSAAGVGPQVRPPAGRGARARAQRVLQLLQHVLLRGASGIQSGLLVESHSAGAGLARGEALRHEGAHAALEARVDRIAVRHCGAGGAAVPRGEHCRAARAARTLLVLRGHGRHHCELTALDQSAQLWRGAGACREVAVANTSCLVSKGTVPH